MIATLLITACQTKVATNTTVAPAKPFIIVTPPLAATGETAVIPPSPTATPSETSAIPTATPNPTTTPSNSITIGSQTDTEQIILGQMLIQLLQANGYDVVDRTGLGGQTAVRAALAQGTIDLAIAQTGTTLTQAHQLPTTAIPSEAEKAIALVRTLDQPLGLTWLAPAAYRSQTILAVTAETHEAGLATIDDLARYLRENPTPLRLCTDSDFYARQQTGLSDLQTFYDFTLPETSIHLVAPEETLVGLHQGDCDVAVAQSNNGRLDAWNLHPLTDNRAFFPVNAAAPVIRSQRLVAQPELERPLNRWGVRLDSQTMRQLIARVELGSDGQPNSGDEEPPAAVAATFLQQSGLLGNIPQIVISSLPNPTNQIIVALTSRLLLENGYDLAPATHSSDPITLHTGLQNGAIDLAWLDADTALRQFYGLPAQQLPQLGELATEALATHSTNTGLYWLAPSHLSQHDVVFINDQTAVFTTQRPTTLNQLAEQINTSTQPATLCTLPNFFNNPDGLVALFAHYGFSLPNSQITLANNNDDLYNQVAAGTCDIGIGPGQNGRFAITPTLHILADPLEFFPNYTLTPVVRQEIAAAYPQIAAQLTQLTAVLTPPQLNHLLARTQLGSDGQPNSGDEETIQTAADLFLCETGLLNGCAQPTTVTPGCRNLIVNGNFEQQTGWNIVETAVPASYTTEQFHQGNQAIQLGSSNRTTPASFSSLSQSITLPEDASQATLTFWRYPLSHDLVGGDIQSVVIYDETFTNVQQTLLWGISDEQAWDRQTFDLSPYLGQTIFLYFGVVNDGDDAPSLIFIDDVALELCD